MKKNPKKPISDISSYQHLTALKKYIVIEISNDDYRVVNDLEEPILYPKYLFEVVNGKIPSGWLFREYEDNEYHIGPIELSKIGFYEDFFDDMPEAKSLFKTVYDKMLKDTTFTT